MGAGAPDLRGLTPDEAWRVCYLDGVGLTVVVSDAVEVRGCDRSRMRVIEQWPGPGARMEDRAVTVRVDPADGGDATGVREPRRPAPPPARDGTPAPPP
jgi:hypothetical protein